MKRICTYVLMLSLLLVGSVASAEKTTAGADPAQAVNEKPKVALQQDAGKAAAPTTKTRAVAAKDDMPAELRGGWQATESPVIPKDVQAAYDKAMEGFVGVSYKPVAYLGYQAVEGRNLCILTQAAVVVPDAKPYYALVYVYEDPEGKAAITHIAELDIAALSEK